MLIVLIFICGFFIGTMVEWFSYKILKEENEPMTCSIKNCFKYAKRVINKRMIISILIGSVYCMFYLKYKTSIDFFRYSSVCTTLFVVALIDYKTKYVYVSTIFIAAVLSTIFIILGSINGIDPRIYLYGGILGGLISSLFAALNVIGWGDVEIFFVCGLLVGSLKLAIVAFIAIVLCCSYGVYLIVTKKSKNFRVAFGPYIVVSLIFTII